MIILCQTYPRMTTRIFAFLLSILRSRQMVILSALLVCFTYASNAQTQREMDSLQTILKTAPEDIDKANILYTLSKAYAVPNTAKSMELANQCLTLSEKLKYIKGIGNSYNVMGYATMQTSDYKSA